jgi:hypothetical protein
LGQINVTPRRGVYCYFFFLLLWSLGWGGGAPRGGAEH